jgi:predicted AlkP superfamily pyrophosphatase or phosphodiesterase
MKRFFAGAAWLAIVLGLVSCTTPATPPRADLLILISIDGFRWDYLRQYEAPVLDGLATGGVHATRLTPSFPSKTFPNHYTLVTGLYPAHHGIVGNWFYDPASGDTFGMSKPASNNEERWWAAGEPVWITAEKQGVRSACFFWPGSETTHDGVRPSFHKAFDKKLRAAERVDGLLAWLALPPAQRPRLATLYFDVVDDMGHRHGPVAPETGAAVREVDEALARLLAGLERLGLRERTDLVIVSDHGMSEQSPDRVIFLEDLMNVSQVQVDSTGPTGGVRPKPGTVTPAELAAQIRAKAPPQLHVWLRDETPEGFHYRGNPRIPDVVLLCDDHWNIESKVGWPKRVPTYNQGNHGWDPATLNMGALFVAHGPSFRRKTEVPDTENIQVYNLLCAALGIKPAPNDGDDRLVRAALAK